MYKVHVCKIAYSHLDIKVEASNSKKAMRKTKQAILKLTKKQGDNVDLLFS